MPYSSELTESLSLSLSYADVPPRFGVVDEVKILIFMVSGFSP
jgi:hypothetical protein